MGVVCVIPIRVDGGRNNRICDLALHDNGKIFIVDIEVEKDCKRQYSVCINKQLAELLRARKQIV